MSAIFNRVLALAAAPLIYATPHVVSAQVVKIDGSSTVFPITEGVAEDFQKSKKGAIKVTVGISGTGGGFKKFCRGETDVQDASRPILKQEIDDCKANGIEYFELPVAFDALTVVINPKNTFLTQITVAELKKMWEPAAQGKIMRWNQVNPAWPDQPMKLFGAGSDSGSHFIRPPGLRGRTAEDRELRSSASLYPDTPTVEPTATIMNTTATRVGMTPAHEGGAAKLADFAQRQLKRKRREKLIELILLLAACVSVFTTLGIVYVLLSESVRFFSHVSLWDFLTDKQWTPLFSDAHFGIAVLLAGTVSSSAVALLIAIPLGTIIAIYLSEFAGHKTRETMKPLLELLSGVPTIIYGYFALLFVTPLIQKVYPGLPGFNVLSAGIVMGIMIIPYVSSLSEDAMRAVPMSLREGSYATGATRYQTAANVVVPAAFSGIAAAYILGISRAVGETMILAVAAGMQPNLTLNPLEPAATVTSYIVQVALGDLPHGSIGYQTIFAAGLMLMLVTLVFNLLGYWLRRKYREAY